MRLLLRFAIAISVLIALLLTSIVLNNLGGSQEPQHREVYQDNPISLSCLEGSVRESGVINGKQYMDIRVFMECENGCD